MQKFKQLVKSINVMNTDVKVEVIIAELLEKAIDIDDIEVIPEGVFDRSYKKDLTNIYVDIVKERIALHISRNSIYDNLPEGLFHPVNRHYDGDNRQKEFKKQRLEEERARKFFRPFDKEFIIQKVALENETRKLLLDPFAELEKWFPNEYQIPQQYFRQLIKYLPFTNKIKGNLDLTAQCLSEILGEKVTAKSYYAEQTFDLPSRNNNRGLGQMNLAENFVCGGHITEDVIIWDFAIELYDEARLEHFVDIENGFIKNLIKNFHQYFTPMEVITKTSIVCHKQTAFHLGESGGRAADQVKANSYLGYNVILS